MSGNRLCNRASDWSIVISATIGWKHTALTWKIEIDTICVGAEVTDLTAVMATEFITEHTWNLRKIRKCSTVLMLATYVVWRWKPDITQNLHSTERNGTRQYVSVVKLCSVGLLQLQSLLSNSFVFSNWHSVYMHIYIWLGGVVVRTLDLRPLHRWFDSRSWHCLVISEIGDRIWRVNYLGM